MPHNMSDRFFALRTVRGFNAKTIRNRDVVTWRDKMAPGSGSVGRSTLTAAMRANYACRTWAELADQPSWWSR